jgi:hypothetical protein
MAPPCANGSGLLPGKEKAARQGLHLAAAREGGEEDQKHHGRVATCSSTHSSDTLRKIGMMPAASVM